MVIEIPYYVDQILVNIDDKYIFNNHVEDEMKTIGYIRVSTNQQDCSNQEYEILSYSQKNNFKVDSFISVEMSSRKNLDDRRINELLEQLLTGDHLIVSELSRLGRSTHEALGIINTLFQRKVSLTCIKQNLIMKDTNDIQTKMMVTMFSLFSELERDLISQRTKMSLQSKKMMGIVLGRPKGKIGTSKLDSKREYILELLKKKVSVSSISRILDCNRGTVMNYIKSRQIRP
jgi:DNA invertase Pin-like site-specific DNA recombinase